MSFHVGQRVVCVDGNWKSPTCPGQENRPIKGGHYTIREIYQECFQQDGWAAALLLYEISNDARDWKSLGFHEAGFSADRFRPLIERSTDTGMAILRKVADDASKKRVLVDAKGDKS